MFTTWDKAIASAIGSFATLAAGFGLDLPTGALYAAVPAVAALLTYLVPNRPA